MLDNVQQESNVPFPENKITGHCQASHFLVLSTSKVTSFAARWHCFHRSCCIASSSLSVQRKLLLDDVQHKWLPVWYENEMIACQCLTKWHHLLCIYLLYVCVNLTTSFHKTSPIFCWTVSSNNYAALCITFACITFVLYLLDNIQQMWPLFAR